MTEGGLASPEGGLGPQHFLASSAIIFVIESPIITHGCGVFVSDNILLTAKHLVEDRIELSDVTVIGVDGREYTVVEILEDSDDDLAIVIIADRTGPYLELGPGPSLGEDVVCIGSPFRQSLQLIITWGRVSSEKWRNNFIYDGFCWSGCSGGPVIIDGKLAGIVESFLNANANLGFATSVAQLDPDLVARIK